MVDKRASLGLKWDLLVADAWADPDLKTRLLADPAGVLKERGIEPPADRTIRVVEEDQPITYEMEESGDTLCFTLPRKPAEEDLSEELVASVAEGAADRGFQPHQGWGNFCGCGGCEGCGGCGCGGCEGWGGF